MVTAAGCASTPVSRISLRAHRRAAGVRRRAGEELFPGGIAASAGAAGPLCSGEGRRAVERALAAGHADLRSLRSHPDTRPGIAPKDAIERLQKYDREFTELDRKYTLFNHGEVLFGEQLPDLVGDCIVCVEQLILI